MVILQQLGSEPLALVSILVWTLLAFVLAIAGGALMGLRLGASALGKELAALMGALFGPVAAVPGVLLGLLILKLV